MRAVPSSDNSQLIYGLNDQPPWRALILLSFQQVVLMSSTLVLPSVLISDLGGGIGAASQMVAMSMLACGLGTMLQAWAWRGFGSGYLCPNFCGPNFFAASVSAAWLGGVPLMRGMTIAAGLAELLFARYFQRIKSFLPTEITGLVLFMVGVGLIPVAMSKSLGIDFAGDPVNAKTLGVAFSTLFIMVVMSLSGRRSLRLYGLLIGISIGYALTIASGLMPYSTWSQLAASSWVGMVRLDGFTDFAFRWELLPVFLIVSLCGSLKTFGNVALAQRVNDPDWHEPDMVSVQGGLFADGLTVTLSGLLGGLASDTSASNVALSQSSGATSRRIAYWAGGLFMLLAFSPKLTTFLALVPTPVIGAILIYITCLVMAAGLRMMLHQTLTPANGYVLGTALVVGLSLDMTPQLYLYVPDWLRPLFGSSLTLATITAIVLSQLLRLTTQQHRSSAQGHQPSDRR